MTLSTRSAQARQPAPPDELAQCQRRVASELYEAGDFLEAARVFERAFVRQPLPPLLFNIGTAYDKAGERKPAFESYSRYVAAEPASRESAVARSRIAILDVEIKQLEAAEKIRAAAAAAAAAARPVAATAEMPHSAPLPYVELLTRHSFPTVMSFDGKPYTLLGTGARKYYGFKVYSMGLFVEEEPVIKAFPKLVAAAGGVDRDSLLHDDLAHKFIVLGEFGKSAVLHFERDVDAKATRDSYRDALALSWGDQVSTDVRRDGDAFLKLFSDVKAGQDVIIHTTAAGQISVETNGKRLVGPINQRLTYDIWAIWLGNKPISDDLKRTILDRILALAR